MDGSRLFRKEAHQMTVKLDEVVAYHVDDEVVCTDCVTDAEMAEVTADDVMTREECERAVDLAFCDRCRERIR